MKKKQMLKIATKVYPFIFIGAFLAVLIIPMGGLNLNPAAIESSFYGRLRLIRAVTDLRVTIGDSLFPNALIGKEGWLFQITEGEIQNYQNDTPFTEEQLTDLQKKLDEVAAIFKKQGTTLVIVVAPTKSSIYQDYMPIDLQKMRSQSRFDQLVQYLKQYGQTQILDLRQELIANREAQKVYYKTDTHWTSYGAFIAYREILKTLQPVYPGLVPRALSDFKPVSEGLVSMDLASQIGSVRIKEERISLNPLVGTKATWHDIRLDDGRWIKMTWNSNENLPKAVIYYDSFFYSYIPWFYDHFSQITAIPHYANGSIWNLSWVIQEKADVVIVEIAERYIHDLAILFNPEIISKPTK
jgi:alginate O-acetyltransferase complex protein AlgJ